MTHLSSVCLSAALTPLPPSLALRDDKPVLHCCSAQKHEVPLDDVIGLCQPLLPVL